MKTILLSFFFLICSIGLMGQEVAGFQAPVDSAFFSTQLDYEKNIRIWVPETYFEGWDRSYPLIIIFDAQNDINLEYMVQTVSYLSRLSQIPECVVVGVEAAPQGGRYRETQLKVNKANVLGEEHDAFIFEELIPYMKANYPVADQTILMGHSRFGFYTSYLLTRHLKDVLGVISMSPFFDHGKLNLMDDLLEGLEEVSLERHLYYVIGGGNPITDTEDQLAMADRLEAKRLPRKFKWKALYYPEADHITVPGLTAGQGLYFIYEEWCKQQLAFFHSAPTDMIALYDEKQAAVKKAYGVSMPWDLGVLNGAGWRLFNEKNYEAAIQCWEILGREYPHYAEAFYFQAYGLKEMGKTEKVEELIQKAREA
jgi:enterochelin esterase-like enzyme